ncbi:MAG: AMP nucleosidase [Rhodobacteraceae bacterium]|nr:AMP nucleosidase [Paracoccaceae bacterium]
METREFSSAAQAVERLTELYESATGFLRGNLLQATRDGVQGQRFRAFYPEVRINVRSHASADSRFSFGHVAIPGEYATTVTRPDLFRAYLEMQIGLLMKNHGIPVQVGNSDTPIPVHFAVGDSAAPLHTEMLDVPLRDAFDVPQLETMNDDIINGLDVHNSDGSKPLAAFTAQRIDYSLARIRHYTDTDAEHFQNFVLFTNYQFYVDGFTEYAQSVLADPASGYTELIAPGNSRLTDPNGSIPNPERTPQMPAYHLKRPDRNGITLVNIGIGPSNAKNATDHIAVLRPRAWLMLGHCAGLRNGQSLGDYVLAHAYLREDHVLDDELPVWVPIPALAEVQVALESAVAEATQIKGFELKRIMRTGTVVSVDNRNWELRATAGPLHRLSQSRAIALDMEAATVAANGFRFRVPYGTLLCVSDKPLQGELKLPGMASQFYRSQVDKHLRIGIRAMESLRDMPLEFLHSRKLRSFDETAFL